jgi:hypothetical protein
MLLGAAMARADGDAQRPPASAEAAKGLLREGSPWPRRFAIVLLVVTAASVPLRVRSARDGLRHRPSGVGVVGADPLR